MKTEQKIFCVISHTHWDREWYAPLEHFRHRLVDLFDRLLAILDEHPEYVFHLDAQTIVLEDYLAVRPEKKELLKQYVAKRRIMVGPWYLQNDFYLTSGEATIRNLLEGDKLCTEFGGKASIGYAPDQFGNISQLPQILKNFGIDNFVFGRGFSNYEYDRDGELKRRKSPTEFMWQGPDGSRVLAVHMRHWYNNAQRFPADLEKSYKYLKSIEDSFGDGYTVTPYLLLMNGVDHLEPQPDLLEVLDGLQKRLPEGKSIVQYNFDDYIRDVRKYIDKNDIALDVRRGELRHGHDWELLKGTLSSRHYLKVANVKAQTRLENRLEPLYAMMERNGMKGVTPLDHLRYSWKNLMRNHPHDSICGCSRDEVHAHMENRYAEFFEFTDELTERAMRLAADHTVACRKGKGDEYLLTVANTLSFPVKGAVRVTMSFLDTDGYDNFEIVDDQGEPVDFMVFDRKDGVEYDIVSPVNLPGTLNVKQYQAYVSVGEVAPYAFKTFVIRNKPGKVEVKPLVEQEETVLKNKYFTVSVSPDGKVDLVGRGIKAQNCVYLEERSDIGDSYVFVHGCDETTRSDGFVTDVRVLEHNDYVQSVAITYDLPLPVDYDFEHDCRSQETAVTRVVLTLSVKKDEPFIHLDYHVENHSKWHRLRVVVDTGIESQVSTADIPFDIVTHGEDMHYQKTYSRVFANTSFAVLQNETHGFAVLTQGAHEYKHKHGSRLAFTVLRATGGINRSPSEKWKVPGNQCLRTIEGSMALAPFKGGIVKAGIPNLALRFRAPLLTAFTSCDTHKFSGGRPCVQDSELNELFYLPDRYPQVEIPSGESAITVKGDGVTVTAFKKAEDGSGLILRMINYNREETTATITAPGQIYRTNMAEKELSYIGRDKATITMRGKQIITLLLR